MCRGGCHPCRARASVTWQGLLQFPSPHPSSVVFSFLCLEVGMPCVPSMNLARLTYHW